MKTLPQILADALPVIKEAASFIQSEIQKSHHSVVEIKSLNSLVTYVDKNAEMILVDGLKKILPEAGFLTEENTIEQTKNDWQWIIDPLDGTTNFIYKIPVFAISVALAYRNEIQLGIVYELNRDECFTAIKNEGAFLNGQLISVSATQQLKDSLVATGFPYYDYALLDNYISLFKELMTDTRGIRRLGSAAIDLCYTACGKFDAFFEYSLSPWDVAAGALILQEAGGKITDFSGGTNWLYGKQILGCNQQIFDEIIDKIKRNF